MFQEQKQPKQCLITWKRVFITSILSAIFWLWFFWAFSMATVQYPPVGSLNPADLNALNSLAMSLAITAGIIASMIGFFLPFIIALFIRGKPDESFKNFQQNQQMGISEFMVGSNNNYNNPKPLPTPGFIKNVPQKQLFPLTLIAIIVGILITTVVIPFFAPQILKLNSLIIRGILGGMVGLLSVNITYYIFFGLCRRAVKTSSLCARCGKPMELINPGTFYDRSALTNVQGGYQCGSCGRLNCFECSDNRYPCECGAQQWIEKMYRPK